MGGLEAVEGAVHRHVAAHRAVGEAHGAVGVGVPALARLHLAHGRHHQAVAFLDVVLGGADRRPDDVAPVVEAALGGLKAQVLLQRLQRGLGQEGLKALLVGEQAGGEDRLRPRLGIALELLLDGGNDARLQVALHIAAQEREHGGGHLLVGGGVIVLPEIFGHGLHLRHRSAHLGGILGVALQLALEAHEAEAQYHHLAAECGLLHVGAGLLELGPVGVAALEQADDLAVLGLAAGVGAHPRHQGLLLGLLLVIDPQALKAPLLADEVLPVIADAGVLAGVLDAHGIAGVHVLLHDLQLLPADLHAAGLLDVEGELHAVAAEEAVGAAGVAHHHGEVALLHAGDAHGEVVPGLERDIGLAGVGGLAIGAGVDAEEAEVARMAGPHPVVGVAAELADGAGRHAHQANIAVGLVHEEVELIAFEHGLEVGAQAVLLAHGGLQLAGHLLDLLVPLVLGHAIVELGHHLGGDIIDPLQEAHAEAGGELLLAVHGIEAVGEVVVLDAAQALHRIVPAVVVGEEEALGAHHLPAAESAAKAHHRVLEPASVDVVDVLGGELEAELLHLGLVDLLELGEQPHALVGIGGQGHHGGQEQGKELLHA